MTAAHQHAGLTGVLRGPFGLLWTGQTTSSLGDGVFTFAFTWQLAVQWHQPGLLCLLLSARVLAEAIWSRPHCFHQVEQERPKASKPRGGVVISGWSRSGSQMLVRHGLQPRCLWGLSRSP